MNVMVITAGAAAAMFALAGVQTVRLGNAQESIGELTAQLEDQAAETLQAVSANGSLNREIDDLAVRIADMVEARRVEREEQDRVLAARDEDLATAVARARRLEGERNAIFRTNVGCGQMAEMRIDTMCPAVADQLRERSSRRGGDGDQDSRGSGGSRPAPPAAINRAAPVPGTAG